MAILIDMDMPEECGKCCFLNIDVFLNNDCFLEGRNPFSDTMDLSRGKPYWCPLREVVRCKDCKYLGQDGYKEGCKYMMCIVTENDWCSFAERREG